MCELCNPHIQGNGLVGVTEVSVFPGSGLGWMNRVVSHMWGHQHHEQKAEALSCEHPLFLVFCQERIELCVWDLVGKVFLGM